MYQFHDLHEPVSAAGLFAAAGAPAAPPAAPGSWVYLSPATADLNRLGQLRHHCQQGGGRLGAVIPEALLLTAQLPEEGPFMHLDCRAHSGDGTGGMTITTLHAGSRIEITASRPEPDLGRKALEKRLLAGAAAACVRETRYDPLHSAAAENELRSALAAVLPELLSERAVQLALRKCSIQITPAMLLAWCQPVWSGLLGLLSAMPGHHWLILSPAAAAMPGLSLSLSQGLGGEVIPLSREASRNEKALTAWLAAELPDDGCWLLQTRPRPVP